MSNKSQRNRQREYCRQATAWANNVEGRLAAAIGIPAKRVTEIEERHIEALTYFVVKGAMIGGLALGWFNTRAAAMRAAFKAGYTHVTGSGCERRERTYTCKIRPRYCVA